VWPQCWDLQGPRGLEQRDLRNLNLGDLKKGPNGGVSPTPPNENAMGSTQPRIETSTRNLPGGKGRPARNTEKPHRHSLEKCGSLDVSQLYRSPGPVTGISLPLPFCLAFEYPHVSNSRHRWGNDR
jgi:hypothetical protein